MELIYTYKLNIRISAQTHTWPQLVDDTRKEILKLLVLGITTDNVGVSSDRRLYLLLEVCVCVCMCVGGSGGWIGWWVVRLVGIDMNDKICVCAKIDEITHKHA